MKRTILILLLSTVCVFAEPPEVVVRARQDFSARVSDTASIDVKRGEQYMGKIYGSYAKIKYNGIWYEVSRNMVSTLNVDPNVPIQK
jgi:hypothetical protein